MNTYPCAELGANTTTPALLQHARYLIALLRLSDVKLSEEDRRLGDTPTDTHSKMTLF